jgi:hypothetical protein
VSASDDDRFRLFSVSELQEVADPQWLLKGLFTLGSIVGVYGPSGHGKSFIALDWALSVAQGLEWQGRAVRQGAVVYVAAEGGGAIRKRVAAWRLTRGLPDLEHAFFILDAVQVTDEDDLALVSERLTKRGIEPVLIVLDTLARCFVGGEENSSKEMGAFVAGLEWIKRRTGATVMVVHHTGKQDTELERGSSALRGAADTMIRISRDSKGHITVTNNKQKDDEAFGPIRLRLEPVVVAEGTDGNVTSCVPVAHDAIIAIDEDVLAPHLRDTLTALAESPEGSLSRRQWIMTAKLPERTLDQHRKELVNAGHVELLTRGRYGITERGRAMIRPATARKLHLVK